MFALMLRSGYMHESRILESADKASIVVFIHGFMGSPRQFDGLADAVYSKGYSVLSLLLPGHGSTLKDFSNATLEDWTDCVSAEIGRLSMSYDRIFIVGHSMGCLLAINASLEHSARVYGLFLIYCPYKLKYLCYGSIKIRLVQMFCKKTNPVKAAYLAACSVPLLPSIIWRIIKPTAQLKKLIAITTENLHNINIPISAIYSLSDEVVSASSLGILRLGAKHTSVRSILLIDSLHAYFSEQEQAVIESALLEAVFVH